MRKRSPSLILFALAIITLGAAPMKNESRPGLAAFDPASLVEALRIGTDPNFDSLMQRHQKVDIHTAPADLRELLAGFEVPRMELVQGFAHRDGRGELTWWMSEIGLVGTAEKTRKKLESTLKKKGYGITGGHEADRWRAQRTTKQGHRVQLRIEGPHPWTGGQRRACGISLAWRIVEGRDSRPPALRSLLAAYPALAPAGLPADLLSEKGQAPLIELSLGGTWSQYYRWSATLASQGQGSGEREKIAIFPYR